MTLQATFVGPAGSLVLSESDQLWAARGILGEGGIDPTEEVMSAYLWAIARRCLVATKKTGYGAMWRAFSQPINPKWRADGEFCRIGGKGYGTDACSPQRTARRQRIATTKWDDIPGNIRDAVERFSRGELPKPLTELALPNGRNRLNNWASYAGVRQRFPWGVEIDGEWFLEDRPMRDGDVTVTAPSEDNRPTIALLSWSGAGLVLASALAVWALYRG